MPPRGAAAAPAGGDPFAALPHALALTIFSRLTVEQRLRCIEVCRGWRATLNDHSAWQRLDLTRADGGVCSEALLRAATSRAGGQLQALSLACTMHDSLFVVAAANAATLQEMRVSAPAGEPPIYRSLREVEELPRAVPQLRMLEADVDCDTAAEAQRVLRNEPPFGPLRVRHILVSAYGAAADEVLALAAALAAHASLAGIFLDGMPLDAPAALGAVVDAALARRLSCVEFWGCQLTPASAPALARLLGGNTLTELCIDNRFWQLLDAPAAALLANALRANTTLTALTLSAIEPWNDAAAATELMGALTAHPRLRLLNISFNSPHGDGGLQAAEAGAALAALLLANAPALRELTITQCGLGDEGMGPVVEALRHNTHLTKLDCSGNDVSEAFSRDVLLPAVRANAALRELVVGGSAPEREAVALVTARARVQLD